MKYLAMTAAAVLLLSVPATSFAQSDTSGSGTTAGSGTGTDNNGGNAGAGAGTNAGSGAASGNNGGTADSNGNGAASIQGAGDSQCSDETPTSSYASMSEKCRHQIDAWAASQAGKSAAFEGDIVEGTVLPDTVEIVEVPAYRNYGYVMLNDRRVLVDRTTHKVVRVY